MNFEAIICSPQRGSSPVLKIPNDWHVFFSPHFFHFGWILRNYQACRVQTCMLESQNLYNMAYSPRHFNSRASTSIQILISISTSTSKVLESHLSHRTTEVDSHSQCLFTPMQSQYVLNLLSSTQIIPSAYSSKRKIPPFPGVIWSSLPPVKSPMSGGELFRQPLPTMLEVGVLFPESRHNYTPISLEQNKSVRAS